MGRSYVRRQDAWISLDADAGVLGADFGLRRSISEPLVVDSDGELDQKVDCWELVAFDIRGIKPGQERRVPKLKVTFEIDASGQLQCRAKELPDRVLKVVGDPEPIAIDEWIR